MEVSGARTRSLAEIAFAAALFAAAGAVIWTARDYPAESAAYPQVLGVALALGALAIAAREIWCSRRGHATPGTFAIHGGRLLLGMAALFVYILGVATIGFVLPSLALGVLLPAVVGFRRHWVSILTVAVSLAAILLIFVVALERPIPPDILSELVQWRR